MLRLVVAVVLAAGLIAAPVLTPNAAAQMEKTDAAAKPKKPLTANQIAARARQKKCAAEWKEAKTTGKIEKGMTWPKYWSACSTRLKAGG